MAKFDPGVPVVSPDPRILVDVGIDQPLPVGRNRFSLVVVDDSGNESVPTEIEILVRDAERPTAILDITDADGTRIAPEVAAGTSFFLSGERSFDLAPGKISEYRFTLMPAV